MIYEKRNAGTQISQAKNDSGKSMTADIKACTVKKAKKESANYGNKTVTNKTYSFVNKRKIKRVLKRAAVVAAMVAVCFLDIRVFEGKIASAVTGAVKNAVNAVTEKETETAPDFGVRTLYTLNYSDNTQSPAAAVLNSTQDEIKTEKPVPVNKAVGEAYVDGTKFYPITALDLSSDDPYVLGNGTDLTPDMREVDKTVPSSLSGLSITNEPLVLILHTHACESYTEYDEMYPADEATRNEDTEKNVVRVGREISDTLSDFDIPAIHCTKLHDKESFINAYSNSASSVKEYLQKYPSIRFVIDVHRDAVIKEDGESIKAVTEIAGEEYAQIMFVVGTNRLGHNHPNWQDNLSLAVDLQKSISDTYPSLCRSINLRDVPFNQQLSGGYLLLEVGTSANTLDEALNSARAFGENLARVIYGAT